jgi:uncharacterized protein
VIPISQYLDQIIALCHGNHVKELAVFGSVLTSNYSENSDIDLIVEFEQLEPLQYADCYFRLKFALEDLFHRPVDLLERKALRNPFLLSEIESKKQLLYAA